MLACIQRRQNFPSQHLNCSAKSVMASAPPLLLPAPQMQPGQTKGEPASMVSRYPSPADLDAFAQKNARSPLTIKIFQTEVRVPQHKQLNKTINGLDTTGQSQSSYPYSGGYQGLLAIVKASVTMKGVVKNSDGKRTKHANGSTSVSPYTNTISNTYRHGHKAYHTSSCKSSDVPSETTRSSTRVASGEPSLPPQAELAQVQSLMRQMSRNPHREAPQLGGEARGSPSVQAVAAVAPQSGVTYAGAVLPTQTAGMAKAVYLDKADYRTSWQQHAQQYQQNTMRMYNTGTHVGQSPESVMSMAYPSHLPYRIHPHGVQDRVSSSSMNCMQGDFSTAPYFAPLWDNNITSTPNSDNSYQSQLFATGICAVRPRDLQLSNHHPKCHQLHHHHQTQHPVLQPHLHSQQAYSADQNLSGGLPTSSLCHAAVLSSSLQSLECLISEIQPPCIKERMLGRGYQAMGMPLLLEHHHQQSHIQLPVYR